MNKRFMALTAAFTVLATYGIVGLAAERTCCYVYDSQNNHVKDSSGQCVRSGTWSPACAVCECDASACPKAEAPPPVRKVEKITLAADAYFDFDKATLKPAGRAKLDEVVEKMRKYENVEAIHVTAYTDRIGTDSYNLKLSDRRARAVMNYLVDHGISAGKIDARGMGEANPVVSCEGVRRRAALIKCLAPNRRAEIEIVVLGTQ
jgi:OmpA-OmpF porin, OOP family